MRRWAPLGVALLLLAGCSDPSPTPREPLPPEWRGRDLRVPGWANDTVPPGYTLALQYDWASGTRVPWDWFVLDGDYFVHFQLVRWDGGDPQPLVAYDRFEDKGERRVVQGGTHQIDWLNEAGRPVTVAHKSPPGYQRILYEPGEGPGCLFGLPAAATPMAPSGPAGAGPARGSTACLLT